MFSTRETFHRSSGWLKSVALSNIPLISVTDETSQPFSGWLNVPAPANILDMSRTLETFHPLMSWLKNFAPANIFFIVTTFEVSHSSIPSKFLRFDFRNNPSMSVISDVSMPPSGSFASVSKSSISSRLVRGLPFRHRGRRGRSLSAPDGRFQLAHIFSRVPAVVTRELGVHLRGVASAEDFLQVLTVSLFVGEEEVERQRS